MALIHLNLGLVAEVDDMDVVYLLMLGSWFVRSLNSRQVICIKNQKKLIMANEIVKRMGYENFDIVDHKDLNPFNFKRENLRPCNRSQNAANQHINPRNKIGYKWVNKVGNKYRACVSKDGVDYHIGYFDSPIVAHEAAKLKAIELFGEFVRSE